eukprot:254061-Chlamydomonas_euryale.AAC.2
MHVHTCQEEHPRVRDGALRRHVPRDLVCLDWVIRDGQAQRNVAANKGEGDGHDKPRRHQAKVHPDGDRARGACMDTHGRALAGARAEPAGEM